MVTQQWESVHMMTIYEALLTQLRYTDVDYRQKSISCSSWEAVTCGLCMFHLCRLELTVRVVADLPCAGFRLQLILHVRKFFCDTTDCRRKIFTERLPAFVEPWARTTVRLHEVLQALGLATCGELGARLASHLAIQTSPTTILRRIMALPVAPVESVSELGIDDFALRRGRKYGTILVDLMLHQVIDLLPDRKAATAKAWMQAHPEIKLVSRDRGGDYATCK